MTGYIPHQGPRAPSFLYTATLSSSSRLRKQSRQSPNRLSEPHSSSQASLLTLQKHTLTATYVSRAVWCELFNNQWKHSGENIYILSSQQIFDKGIIFFTSGQKSKGHKQRRPQLPSVSQAKLTVRLSHLGVIRNTHREMPV